MPKKVDESSSSDFSEEGIPAMEILNYDLINIGLKSLTHRDESPLRNDPVSVSSSFTSASKSRDGKSSTVSGGNPSNQKGKTPSKNQSVSQSSNNTLNEPTSKNSSATKMRFKIGYLPPSEASDTEKAVCYEDHNHFLKLAASKAKTVRKNSIRSMNLSLDDLDVDIKKASLHSSSSGKSSISRSNIPIDDSSGTSDEKIGKEERGDTRRLNKVNSPSVISRTEDESKTSKPHAVAPLPKAQAKKKNLSTMSSSDDSDSEYSDDGIPAVEILNYDLVNIGLKSLQKDKTPISQKNSEVSGLESSVSSTSKVPSAKHSVSQGSESRNDEVPSVDRNSQLLSTKLSSSKSSGISSSFSNKNEPLQAEHLLKSAKSSDDGSSDSSDEGIPAVEILNYDLNNVGLKAFDDRQNKNTNDFKLPVPQSSQNVIPSPVHKDEVEDDSSDESDDGIPAIEILNYDLNNVGLKKLFEPTAVANLSDSKDSTQLQSSSSRINTGSPINSPSSEKLRPSCESSTLSEQDDASEESDDGIPAVEILNYDLVNAGLKNFTSKADNQTSKTLASNNIESSSKDKITDDTAFTMTDNNITMTETKAPNASSIVSSQDNYSSDESDDGIPAVEILNYDLINAGLKNLHTNNDSHTQPVDNMEKIDPIKSRTSSDDCSSQQTKVSSIPGKEDFEDYGHFLSIEAQKATTRTISQPRNVRTAVDSSVLPPNPITQPIKTIKDNYSSETEKMQHRISPGIESGVETNKHVKVHSGVIPTESIVTTVVTTKTIVEPDGTVVTTTIVTTKSIPRIIQQSDVSNDNTPTSAHPSVHSNPPQENDVVSIKSDFKGETTATMLTSQREYNSSDCKPFSSEDSSLLENQSTNKGNYSHGTDTNSLDKGNNSQYINHHSNGISREEVKYFQPPVPPRDHNDLPSVVPAISSVSESTIFGSNHDEVPNTTKDFKESSSKMLHCDSSELAEKCNIVDKNKDENSSGDTNCDSNVQDSQLSVSNGSLTVKRDKFVDHIDFLAEAASYQSDIELQSLAEEDKRNDEIAKRKILSFRKCTDVSPLPSPGMSNSERVNALVSSKKSLLMTNSDTGSVDDYSQSSNSDVEDSIPAKEILNYDLVNIGLKGLNLDR